MVVSSFPNLHICSFEELHLVPEVFVTPVHSIPHQRKDAASVWSRDVTTMGFKLYLREVTNFSGGHANIRVVSLLWNIFDMADCTECFRNARFIINQEPVCSIIYHISNFTFHCFCKWLGIWFQTGATWSCHLGASLFIIDLTECLGIEIIEENA